MNDIPNLLHFPLSLSVQSKTKISTFDCKMSNPWRSERLLYRAVEVEDEAFLSSLSNDAEVSTPMDERVSLESGKRD